MGFGQEISRETLEDMAKIRAVVDTLAPEEFRDSLARDYPTPPLPSTAGYDAYQLRMQRGLAEIVAAQAAANLPKKRGRPRKDGEPVETSQHTAMDAGGETAATD